MFAKILDNFEKILILGPIYNNMHIFEKIETIHSKYDYIVINGNIGNSQNIKNIIDVINKLETKNIIYNLGHYDLLYLKNENSEHYQWFKRHGNVVIFNYNSMQSIIITNGGITPNMKKNDLKNNIETSFVSYIENTIWHKKYGGGFGYIVSNNPLTEKLPTFYSFSCQIGLTHDNFVCAQEVLKNGLGETIYLS